MAAERRYVLLTNPGHMYAAAIVEACKKKGVGIIALFTLRWRHEAYLTRFPELGATFHKVLCLFDLPTEGVLRELEGQLAEERPRLAVPVPWDDSSGILAGRISDHFGLGWNSADVMTRFKVKSVMRAHLEQFPEIPRVASRVARSLEECLEFQNALGTWPIVLKPTDAGSSWNVYIARSNDEIRSAFARVFQAENVFDNTVNDVVQVEEYVAGVEYCVNGLTDKYGNVLVTDVFRYHHKSVNGLENFISEDEYLQPDDPIVAELAEATRRILRCGGLRSAPFHAELRWSATGPKLIEIQARFAGHLAGFVMSAICPDLMRLALDGYLGELEFERPLTIHRPERPVFATTACGASERAGMLQEIVGHDEVSRLPSFVNFSLLPTVGDKLEVTADEDRLLFVALLAHEVEERLRQDLVRLRETLHFVVE